MIAVIIIVGACLGSFLNVCIYRLPKEQSIIRPASRCPHCNTPLRWYDNIPILSYIMLWAHCRVCKKVISPRYVIVELLTAAAALALYSKFGITLSFVQYLFFFCMLIVVSFIDIEYHAIPAILCFMGIVFGLVVSLWQSVVSFQQGFYDIYYLPISQAFIGLIFGLGFSYLFKFFGDIFVHLYLHFIKKESIEGETESLGLGDVDFMGMVGVFLGAKAAVLVFFIAPFFAIIYSLFALVFKKSHLIPYLPYLSLATVVAFFFGKNILGFFL